ncbi:capsular biosynthesis protein [bacterium]|nr:capsular biosynthesis protein [bacterium]MBU1958917.1 capsular biosynthesis protein [bacterium]
MSFFPFFSKEKQSLVDVDLHSHLIPGIDDGAKDMERSIELILSLKEMGYKKLITTPHVSDMFLNSSETILKGYQALKAELTHRKIEIDIEVAAEYYADEHFEALLSKKDILTFGKEKYLLFELSYFTPHHDLESLVYDIKLAGYTPVLAHPERYVYLHDTIDEYINLKSMGVLFQINLNAIENYYSSEVTQTVKKLIAYGLVDFIGSDTHHRRHTKFLKESFSNALYQKIFKHNTILNDTLL